MGLDIMVHKIVHKRDVKDIYDYISLIDNDGNYENNFPEWTKQFEESLTEDWYDWKKYKEETGIDVNECENIEESYSEEGCFMKLLPKGIELPEWNENYWEDWDEYQAVRDKILLTIDLEKVPTYKKEIKVLYYNNIGYQRKGLNDKFYDDSESNKIDYYVWSKEELERRKQEYCDEIAIYSDGETYRPKDNFQKNIIDNFIEGECCVCFSW